MRTGSAIISGVRAAAVLGLVFVFAASASAAGPPPGLKASVKGSTVTITNGSTQALTGYFINSTDSPKITGSSDKTCKTGTSPWQSQGKKHVDYWLDCKGTVAAGKTATIKLTESGSGTVFVWAKIGKMQYKIGQGG
jgi:hypothetical protein